MWVKPASHLMLAKDEVHIWLADLDQAARGRHSLWELLDPKETARARRYYRAQDQLRFAAGRAILRQIAAGYLSISPRQVRFVYGPHGKPYLAARSKSGLADLQFNLSHSGPLAAYAFAFSARVGIDIEELDRWAGVPSAARYFTQSERLTLQRLAGDQQKNTFFRLWTQKEAYLKANGSGLASGLNHGWFPHPTDSFRAFNDPMGDRWSLWRLSLPPGREAALVVEGVRWQLKYLEWC